MHGGKAIESVAVKRATFTTTCPAKFSAVEGCFTLDNVSCNGVARQAAQNIAQCNSAFSTYTPKMNEMRGSKLIDPVA